MHRFCLVLLLLAGLWPSSQASAQTINGLQVYYDGTLVKNSNNLLLLNTQQCADNINIKFNIRINSMGGTGTGGNNTLLSSTEELWWGPSSCRASSQRKDPQGNDCSQAPCTLIQSKTIQNAGDLAMTVKAKDLFPDCKTGKSTVTLVAVMSPSCGSPGDDQFTSEYSATFQIRGEPDAPTKVTVGNGDSALSASWKASSNARTTDKYKVYVDTAPGPNCGNEMLMEGMEPSEADMLAMVDEIQTFSTSETSKSLSTSGLGLAVGDFAAVYVATVDTQADIQGKLSAMGCGERISTEGPVSAYERETGKSVQTCSGGDGRSAAGGSAAVLMGLLGLWLVRRRESRA